MLSTKVEVTDNKLELKLTTLRAGIDKTVLLDEAGALMLNRIRTRFLSEVAPDNTPWVPSLAAINRRKHGGTGTLFDTGRLFHSIQLHTDSETERSISTDVPYARALQEGGVQPRESGHGFIVLPPRMFLGFGEEDKALVTRLLALRVAQVISA